jgi:Ca2+-binding EF-hand superfamily protein
LNILKSAAAQNAAETPSYVIKTSQTTTSSYTNYNSSISSKTNDFNNNNNSTTNLINHNTNIISNSNSNLNEFSDVVKQNMKLLFEQFDKDNDGKITKHELNFVMCNLFPDEVITEQDIDEMLGAADLDSNGYIDFEGRLFLFLF